MKLAEWRKRERKSQVELASDLGCSQPFISQIERARTPIVPGPEIMERIFALTGGDVEPNDFYDVPRWRRALSAALAALTGKAA